MKKLVIYEIKNMSGNFFGVFFGLFFPIMMTHLLTPVIIKEIPEAARGAAAIQIFVGNIMMVPLAMMFVGFAALFSQEIEKNVIGRLSLFGISEAKQMQAKIIAQAIGTVVGMLVFTAATAPFIGLKMPSTFAFIAFIASLSALGVALFILSFGITLLARRFSITYGITMTLYFGIMILSGMMGINLEDMPAFAQTIGKYLPTAYMPSIFPKIWQESSYNFMPMIQAFIFFTAISALVCYVGLRRQARKIG